MAVAGLTIVAIGAPAAGVGAGPGIQFARVGGAISTFGAILEVATNSIAGDNGQAVRNSAS